MRTGHWPLCGTTLARGVPAVSHKNARFGDLTHHLWRMSRTFFGNSFSLLIPLSLLSQFSLQLFLAAELSLATESSLAAESSLTEYCILVAVARVSPRNVEGM